MGIYLFILFFHGLWCISAYKCLYSCMRMNSSESVLPNVHMWMVPACTHMCCQASWSLWRCACLCATAFGYLSKCVCTHICLLVMFVNVSIYLHTCFALMSLALINIFMYMHIHFAILYVSVFSYIYVYLHVNPNVCEHVFTIMFMFMCTNRQFWGLSTCVFISLCVCICMCTFVCTCIYVCVHPSIVFMWPHVCTCWYVSSCF